LTGTFHCRLCPVWPPTAAQYVRSGAWTLGDPFGCLPRSGFCCKAPNRACWNVHALPAKKSKLLFFSSSKSFHVEGKSNSPFGDVHCIETSLPTKAVPKNYQELETKQIVHMCKYNHICIFGCIGHVFEVKMIYYVCIGKVSLESPLKSYKTT
jgi:hypothetical protein